MKKVRILILALTFFGAIPSCKKGENDPLISIRSRDARITGKWKVINSESISNYDGNISSNILNGSILTETSNGSSSSYSYTSNWEITSNGTINYTVTRDGSLLTGTDTWNWLDDSQKKSKISIGGEIYVVDRLTNKEIVLKYQYSSVSGNDIDNYSSSITLEKE
jgi:hypothetical protein